MTEHSLIIAPHVDDEMIGCSTLLLGENASNIDVMYLYELTPTRVNEAKGFTRLKGGRAYFGFDDENVEFLKSYKNIYIPRNDDHHADHKETYRRFIKYATHVYSVDMNGCKPLAEDQAYRKRVSLNIHYPSQSSLWEHDARYYLFEGIMTIEDWILENHYFSFYVFIKEQIHEVKLQCKDNSKVKHFYTSPGYYDSFMDLYKALASEYTGKIMIRNPNNGNSWEI